MCGAMEAAGEAAPAVERAEDDGEVVLSGIDAVAEAARLKAEGNDAVKLRLWAAAADKYARAIKLTPTNHVLYSNRSMCFLQMGGRANLEAALGDGAQCTVLSPRWAKGWGRKGDALWRLGRLDEAIAAYKAGLAADEDNAKLKDDLGRAEAERDSRLEAARAAQTAASAAALGLGGTAASQASATAATAAATVEVKPDAASGAGGAGGSGVGGEMDAVAAELTGMDADLAELLGVVEQAEQKRQGPAVESSRSAAAKTAAVDLGTSELQINRILQRHYKFINLNPFEVLVLDTDATEKDIKVRYRDLAALVHPDKNVDPRARDAFEEVNKAHQQLMNKDRRQLCVALIQQAKEEVRKRRKKELKRGIKEAQMNPLEHDVMVETRKMFADIDRRKKRYETGMQKDVERQIYKETDRVDKIKQEARNYQTWSKTREKRVGDWRDFAKHGKKRRVVKVDSLDKADAAAGAAEVHGVRKSGQKYKKGFR